MSPAGHEVTGSRTASPKQTQAGWIVLLLVAVTWLAVPKVFSAQGLESIPNFPGSKNLCDEHISGTTGHIAWKSFTSEAVPSEVAAFFEKKLGIKPSLMEGTYTFPFPENSVLKLLVAPSAKPEKFPACGKSMPASAQSLIVVSQGFFGKSGD